MARPARSRPIVSLIAAYVVALQAFLLPLAVAAGAPFDSSICTSSADSSHQPANHDSGCPCAAGCGTACCAQALLGPPQASIAPARTYARAEMTTPAIEAVVRPFFRGPQAARAPPAA